jgi:hypothetical protein
MPSTQKNPIQRKMVGWYDPFQLLRTAKEVVVSSLLGVRADYRLLESLAAEQGIFDYTDQDEVWLDYVADLGDGWDATYTIACLLSATSLTLRQRESRESVNTERGRILVMGGDQIYPTASRSGYEERTLGPYDCAFHECDPPHSDLFATPGNHDWYDGLVSFSRLFCQGRWFGGRQTKQRRSYFALRLPHNWWLWGVDIQLESDIDRPQIEYFRKVTEAMKEGDLVIIATAEPHWIYGNIYDPALQSNLAFLEEKIIQPKARVQVWLAGDLHHYRRHETTDGSRTQLITAGGGGAFLHPTFGPPVPTICVGPAANVSAELRSEFPDQMTSKRLLRRNLLFPFLNPRFGILTGLVYLAVGGLLLPLSQQRLLDYPLSLGGLCGALRFALGSALRSPLALFLILVVIGGFIAFTDTHNKTYKWVAGSIHGVAHLLVVVFVAWVVVHLVNGAAHATPGSLADTWLNLFGSFLGGYFLGAVLMGLYLYVSLRFFRRHSNEAFSSLHIPDYKNFLRMRIDRRGQLTVFPIGIETVPRTWKAAANPGKGDPRLVPKHEGQLNPFLIEPPITLDGRR